MLSTLPNSVARGRNASVVFLLVRFQGGASGNSTTRKKKHCLRVRRAEAVLTVVNRPKRFFCMIRNLYRRCKLIWQKTIHQPEWDGYSIASLLAWPSSGRSQPAGQTRIPQRRSAQPQLQSHGRGHRPSLMADLTDDMRVYFDMPRQFRLSNPHRLQEFLHEDFSRVR